MDPDIELLAAAVGVAEAGGESDPRAIPAVLELMRNRVGTRWPDLASAVLAPKQFSCLNGVADLDGFVQTQGRHPRFLEASIAAAGPGTDYTRGATHYCRVDCNPSWAEGLEPTVEIERHMFYRLSNNGPLPPPP
jgi:spore germination cell wall hydrolase CwlJ-like protein